jgi:hypothetical protein
MKTPTCPDCGHLTHTAVSVPLPSGPATHVGVACFGCLACLDRARSRLTTEHGRSVFA